MMLRWLMASLHLLALPLGLGALLARGRALAIARKVDDLPAVFRADNLWSLAGFLWIGTGLLRLLGGLEKTTDYYLDNRAFNAKMALLVVMLLLEIRVMVTLIKWRIARRRGTPINMTPALVLARISRIQAGLVILMVFAATAMSRGLFF